tara:strand:- start:43 stop:222 length:180 start_codon:yes stop_codon:yes gene_type:complete
MATYAVTFTPIETFSMTYHVDCDDPNNVEFVALDDLKIDIGYDQAKSFQVESIRRIGNG